MKNDISIKDVLVVVLIPIIASVLIFIINSVIGNPFTPQVEVQYTYASQNPPPYYSIPLDKTYQDYTWDLCNEYGLSYEMVLSIMYVDSQMNFKDGDLFLLDSGITQNAIKELSISDYDQNNIYQNIEIAVYHINELRDYFSKSMSDEDAFGATIFAYHLGIEKTNDAISKHGIDSVYSNEYVYDVCDYKTQLEYLN